jgi:hypothetical protein
MREVMMGELILAILVERMRMVVLNGLMIRLMMENQGETLIFQSIVRTVYVFLQV